IAGMVLLSISISLLIIPIWRDRMISLTARILSTLVVVLTNLWMGRASITASGGFNCICSLVMLGAATALFMLRGMRHPSRQGLVAAITVICAAFVASFSFGSGLSIWPTAILLAWCLRLPMYSIALLVASAIVTAVLFILLPSHGPGVQLQ